MKDRKQAIRNRIVMIFSAILTLLPMGYWSLTEGQKPMYEESHFSPNYFIMLIVSVVIAVCNCLLNRKIGKDRFLYIMECTVGALIALVSTIVIISYNTSYEYGLFDFVWPVALCGVIIILYEIMQSIMHCIIDLLIEKIGKRFLSLLLCVGISSMMFTGNVLAADDADANEAREEMLADYEDYQMRMNAVSHESEIEEYGFWLIEKQVFPMETDCFGAVFMIPAIEKNHHRLVLFFATEDGSIVYRTDRLEVNNWNKGQLWQPVRRISAVSFQELNGDGLTDIVLIVTCVNRDGEYKGKEYKVGEVLFQDEKGFYRDYRISDKINRFGMNKSVESITAFVRDGYSTEFLYTADTKGELLRSGFKIATDQSHKRQFEKLGSLEVVPGTYTMAEFSHFMIYLVNEQGSIVWSLQPMGSYDNLYALKGIKCLDIDGDGMKDILVYAKYSTADRDNELLIEGDYSVYYQRTGGFEEDKEIKESVKVTEEDTMTTLLEKTRAYWGWSDS